MYHNSLAVHSSRAVVCLALSHLHAWFVLLMSLISLSRLNLGMSRRTAPETQSTACALGGHAGNGVRICTVGLFCCGQPMGGMFLNSDWNDEGWYDLAGQVAYQSSAQ